MTEQEIEQAYVKWMAEPNPIDGGSLRDAFHAAYRLGRDKGLAEAAQIPSMMPYVFAVGADIRELESAITALMTITPHQSPVEGEWRDAEDGAKVFVNGLEPTE